MAAAAAFFIGRIWFINHVLPIKAMRSFLEMGIFYIFVSSVISMAIFYLLVKAIFCLFRQRHINIFVSCFLNIIGIAFDMIFGILVSLMITGRFAVCSSVVIILVFSFNRLRKVFILEHFRKFGRFSRVLLAFEGIIAFELIGVLFFQ